MIKHSFHQRALETEDMDDFSIKGEELNGALRYLAFINRFLGGHQIILQSLQKALFQLDWIPKIQTAHLIDLGCGGGDILCQVANWANDKGLALKIDGIDANPNILAFARENSTNHPEINYIEGNFLAHDFDWEPYQIVLCSLILHHFENHQIVTLLRNIPKGTIVIVNDLQRHWLAFYLFKVLCWFSRAPLMARKDGAISVRKGFSRKELEQLVAQSNVRQFELNWRWAFRYQLILVK